MTKILTKPKVVLFDWHATLVDTVDAMYQAVDEVLPQLEHLGIYQHLLKSSESKTPEDAKLVDYIRTHRRLHPQVKAARKISRTDIFEVLFGTHDEAKHIAHLAFSASYRKHFGMVYPFEEGVREMLAELRRLGLMTGVLTNRDREFLEHELAAIEGVGWRQFFDTTVCGDDTRRRKPSPDPVLKALANLNVPPGLDCWYVGDSTTDTISSKRAGVTNVFYNGAKWDHAWIDKIFPNTVRHPYKPDAVVSDFQEFLRLVRCSS